MNVYQNCKFPMYIHVCVYVFQISTSSRVSCFREVRSSNLTCVFLQKSRKKRKLCSSNEIWYKSEILERYLI
jgi:hypothetical protein